MEKLSLVKNGYEGTQLSRSLVDTIEKLPDGKYNIYIVKKESLPLFRRRASFGCG